MCIRDRFDTFTVVSTEGMPNNYGSGETVVVEVTLLGSTQAMIDAGVDFNYMDSTGGQDRSAVSLKWQLSKDPETECWLSDTLFFVPVSQKSKTMQQLNQDVSESTKFVGTLALHMWGAHVALLRTLHRQMVCQEYANAHAHGRVCVCALARAHTHRHRQAGHAHTHTHTHTHTSRCSMHRYPDMYTRTRHVAQKVDVEGVSLANRHVSVSEAQGAGTQVRQGTTQRPG